MSRLTVPPTDDGEPSVRTTVPWVSPAVSGPLLIALTGLLSGLLISLLL